MQPCTTIVAEARNLQVNETRYIIMNIHNGNNKISVKVTELTVIFDFV